MPVKSLLAEFNSAEFDDEPAAGPDPEGRSTSERKRKPPAGRRAEREHKDEYETKSQSQAGGAASKAEIEAFNQAFDKDVQESYSPVRSQATKLLLAELAAKQIPHIPFTGVWRAPWSMDSTYRARLYPSDQVVFLAHGDANFYHHKDCHLLFRGHPDRRIFAQSVRAIPRENAAIYYNQPRRTRNTCCGNLFD